MNLLINSLIFFVLLSVCTVSTAAGNMHSYKTKNFLTITGRVQNSYIASPPGTNNQGLHLTVRTAFTEYIIHVSPQWYVNSHPDRFNFKQGDLITVSGARFPTGFTQNNIYAAMVTNHSSGALKLQLRDPNTGAGLWTGRFQGQMQNSIQNQMMLKMMQTVKFREERGNG